MTTVHQAGAEEKIKEVARKVFLEKGFEGTKMRDIAELAGINSALPNYYFRSKERLFWLVFDEILSDSLQETRVMLNSDKSLRDKIRGMIDHQFQFHMQNPKLALFLMNEINRNPEHIIKKAGILDLLNNSRFYQQVKSGVDQGKLRPIDPSHLLGMMSSSVQQLFAGKVLHMYLFQTDEAGFKQYAEEQKKITIDMIFIYLFLTEE